MGNHAFILEGLPNFIWGPKMAFSARLPTTFKISIATIMIHQYNLPYETALIINK
jgi:hypothetical protein